MDHDDGLMDRMDAWFARQNAEILAAVRGEIIMATSKQIRQIVFAIWGVLLAVGLLLAAVLGIR